MEGVLNNLGKWSQIYPALYDLVVTLLIVLMAWVLAKIVVSMPARLGRQVTSRTALRLNDYVAEVLRLPLTLLILASGLYVALQRLEHRQYQWVVEYRNYIGGFLFVVGVGIVVLACVRILGTALRWYLESEAEREAAPLPREFIPLIDNGGKIVLFMVGIMIILDHFGIDIRSIVVAMGVGGLAVGLALQDTLANLFAGITIALDRPFRVNDRIQMQSGETGDVVHIGMRSTQIHTLDNNILVIPNKTLVNNNVINHSYPDQKIRLDINIGVAYGTDTQKAQRLMEDIARAQPEVLKDPAPQAFFVSFGESSLDLRLLVWIGDYARKLVVTDRLNHAIDAAFKQAGIEIPFPQRVIYVREL